MRAHFQRDAAFLQRAVQLRHRRFRRADAPLSYRLPVTVQDAISARPVPKGPPQRDWAFPVFLLLFQVLPTGDILFHGRSPFCTSSALSIGSLTASRRETGLLIPSR